MCREAKQTNQQANKTKNEKQKTKKETNDRKISLMKHNTKGRHRTKQLMKTRKQKGRTNERRTLYNYI